MVGVFRVNHRKRISKSLSLILLGLGLPASLAFGGAAELRKARQISTRLTGAPFVIGDSRLTQMETLITNGQLTDAATLATNDPGFTNNILRLFAAPFQSKGQSFRDIAGTESAYYIMGIIRDEHDIGKILYGQDFYYNPTPACQPATRGYQHYTCATEYDYSNGGTGVETKDLSSDSVMTERTTRLLNIWTADTPAANGVIRAEIPSADLAGIFTQRGFGGAAGFAGTNRAYIQMMVNQLWCLPLDAIRSSTADTTFIGRDVSRNPDGTGLSGTFSTQCKTCHGPMDGLRNAFAYVEGGRDVDANGASIRYSSGVVLSKYSRNSTTFPTGFTTTNNNWTATFTPAQLTQFGWVGPTQGTGVQSFAQAIGQTQQFYRCMVQKVSDLVCPSDPMAVQTGGAQALSPSVREDFATQLKNHRNLKRTFKEIAVRPECLGG
jgi:hypothetical protein